MIKYFSFFLVCHLINDFVLQTDSIAKCKEKKILFSKEKLVKLSTHVIILFLTSILFYFFQSKLFLSLMDCHIIIKSAFFISLAHLVIDWIKPYNKLFNTLKFEQIYIYLFDQLLHLLTIYFVLCYFLPKSYLTIFQLEKLSDYSPSNATTFFLVLSVCIITTFFGAYFIKLFLLGMNLKPQKRENIKNKKTKNKKTTEEDILGVGKIIGLLERILITVLVSIDAYAGVATVIALKSLARFKNIEKDRDFAEYYLVGNLLSLTFSIFGGLIIKFLLF